MAGRTFSAPRHRTERVLFPTSQRNRPVRGWVQDSQARRARSARPIQFRRALGVVRPLVGEVVQQEVLRCGHARCPGFGGRGRPLAAARRAPLEGE